MRSIGVPEMLILLGVLVLVGGPLLIISLLARSRSGSTAAVSTPCGFCQAPVAPGSRFCPMCGKSAT